MISVSPKLRSLAVKRPGCNYNGPVNDVTGKQTIDRTTGTEEKRGCAFCKSRTSFQRKKVSFLANANHPPSMKISILCLVTVFTNKRTCTIKEKRPVSLVEQVYPISFTHTQEIFVLVIFPCSAAGPQWQSLVSL